MFKKFISLFIKNPDDYSSPETRAEYGKFSSVLSIILNAILFGIKLLAGIITGATSVIADALNVPIGYFFGEVSEKSSNEEKDLLITFRSMDKDMQKLMRKGFKEVLHEKVFKKIKYSMFGRRIKAIYYSFFYTFLYKKIGDN
jgi:hypothetical protein